MNEIQVSSLIGEGETTRIEFKRELDLATAHGKAEFVKDVIALANSVDDVGYMLVGVDNSKMIVDVHGLAEEQIQQILTTYVEPFVIVTCEIIPMSNVGFLSVGVLEISPTKKPHSVARGIENVTRNKVFVRHGTVVVEASPDEIFAMRDLSKAHIDSQAYIRSAETHVRLKNFDMAIQAYTKAIELTPTAELFLARGKVYESLSQLSKEKKDWKKVREAESRAFKDFTDASRLATTKQVETTARLRRFRIDLDYVDDPSSDAFDWLAESDWLTANTSGSELGEVLFITTLRKENPGPASAVITIINRVIELGYDKPKVYTFRAQNHYWNHNFGLALEDTQRVYKAESDAESLLTCLGLEAAIEWRLPTTLRSWVADKFIRVYEILKAVSDRVGEYPSVPDGFGSGDLASEILYRCALDHMISDEYDKKYDPKGRHFRKWIVQVIALEVGNINRNYPKIAKIIRDIVGEDYWAEHRARLE